MGHAHHFLSRLDRVSFEHVELALSLYRDEGLLQYILASAHVPESYERVAISLDHPEEGPFLVVTREGRFVTCLGAGMKPSGLFVIRRERLDAMAQKIGALRERMARGTAHAEARGGRGALLRRIYDAGPRLSREDMTALVAMQPFLWHSFYELMLEAREARDEAHEALLGELRRADKLARRHDDLLDAHWKLTWAVGHLVALSVAGGPAQFEGMPEEGIEAIARIDFTRLALDTGVIGAALRGVWATARLGKLALADQKRGFDEAERYIDVVGRGLSLSALGYRHARLRAEVAKALATGPRRLGDDNLSKLLRSMATTMGSVYDQTIATPEKTAEVHHHSGANFAAFVRRWVEPGSPYHFKSQAEVPGELSMCVGANVPLDWMGDTTAVVVMAAVTPWVARAALEDLYLPADFLAATRFAWGSAWSLRALHASRKPVLWATSSPAGPKPPPRNGACPCGSGKKYKRCCGAAERA